MHKRLGLLCFLSLWFHAQDLTGQTVKNYWEYHERVHRAELQFLGEQFQSALTVYDSIFQEFDYIFVKDYLIAAQLSMLLQDSARALVYLEKAVSGGYKTAALKPWRIFKGLRMDSLLAREPSLARDYRKKINLTFNQQLSKNFRYDEDNKSTREAERIFDYNFRFIAHITDSLGFPGARMVGIDDERFDPPAKRGNTLAHLEDKEAANTKVITSLLHYGASVSGLGYETCMQAIATGQLHPSEFAEMYSFERLKNRKTLPPGLPELNFGRWSLGPANAADCQKFFLLTPAQEGQKLELERKYGIKLSFGH